MGTRYSRYSDFHSFGMDWFMVFVHALYFHTKGGVTYGMA